ncbi:MAG: NAD(P)H-hydrate epimerase [Phycisphaerae bacterium]|nr:NAD(P)H-hydrate epimerase [Phycisphaerae bacterium]
MRLTRTQAREIDRRCVEEFHIPSIILMENAARAVADAAMQMLSERRSVLILCGGGNNGGDGLAAARHLHNRGCAITIGLTIDPAKFKGDALTNWQIVQAMNLPVIEAVPDAIAVSDADLIIDAIFGTGLDKPPRPPFDQIVAAIEQSKKPVLAVDVPSGLDCDTGKPLGPCIRATATVTFVAEKAGFPNAADWTGRVIIGDIGAPRDLFV